MGSLLKVTEETSQYLYLATGLSRTEVDKEKKNRKKESGRGIDYPHLRTGSSLADLSLYSIVKRNFSKDNFTLRFMAFALRILI